MPRYQYTATNPQGQASSGTLEAATPAAARWALREQALRPLRIEPAPETNAPLVSGQLWLRIFPPRQIHIELSLRQIAVMLRSGLPLLATLETVVEQAPSRSTKFLWEAVRDAVTDGASLHDALKPYRRRLGAATLQLVAIGEESGNLDTVLEQAATAMEERRILLQQTLSALTYPAITLIAAIAITVYMVLGVIPQMERFLTALGRQLPAMTQSLLDFSNFLQLHGPRILVFLFIIVAVSIAFYLWPPGRLQVDRIVLRLPLFGKILRTSATAAFSRSVALLLQSGIPLLDTLAATRDLHRNRFFAKVVDNARLRIIEGENLADGLRVKKAYTPMLPKMVGVGEASGTLDEILHEMARFHESALKNLIKQLSALVEPAIILFVGGVVGYVYIAFFMGLFAATGAR